MEKSTNTSCKSSRECEKCGEDSYCIYITKDYKKICGKCYDEEYRGGKCYDEEGYNPE